MSKRGRPRIDDDRKRTERVNLAVSREEFDRICRAAASLRMGVSAFIRLMAVPGSMYSPLDAHGLGSKQTTDSVH